MSTSTSSGIGAVAPAQHSTTPSAPNAYRAFVLGSFFLAFVGFGHLFFAELGTRIRGKPDDVVAIERAMSSVHPMEGSTHSLADFHTGDSFAMGIAVLAYGAASVLLGRYLRANGIPLPKGVLVVNAVAAWLLVGLAAAFFPPQPVAFLGLAAIGFTAALVLAQRGSRA